MFIAVLCLLPSSNTEARKEIYKISLYLFFVFLLLSFCSFHSAAVQGVRSQMVTWWHTENLMEEMQKV